MIVLKIKRGAGKVKKIISLGLGVQSSALYLMSSMGELPRADYAVFADTGGESRGTYDYLKWLLDWKEKNNGIPIAICKEKNLYKDLLSGAGTKRFMGIPAFIKKEDGAVGMLKRQCTADYKIKVIDDFIRDHIYSLPKYARRPATELWHGITLDEIERLSIPREAWKINTYPFVGRSVFKDGNDTRLLWAKKMDRNAVVLWHQGHGFPVPPKSACVFCPYQSDHTWATRKENYPEDFKAAMRIDKAIRNSTAQGVKHPAYLHVSCKPLNKIQFDKDLKTEWGECTGHCHT